MCCHYISEHHRVFAKTAKTSFLVIRAQFFNFLKKWLPMFLMKNPKMVLVLNFLQPQWKCQCRATLQSLAKLDVLIVAWHFRLHIQQCIIVIKYSWVARQSQVGTSLGRRHNLVRFQTNLRPVLDSSAQITRGNVLGFFFVKPQNGYFACFCYIVFFKLVSKKLFPGGFRHSIGILSSRSIL